MRKKYSDASAPRIGRPPVEIDPVQLEKLSARWLTKEAAADFMGISRKTLYTKMQENPALEEAWRRGRAVLQANIMDKLVTKAQEGDIKALMFLAERVCGLHPKALEQDAAAQADDTAQHVRAALQRMILIENGQVVIDQQQAHEREPVEIDRT